MCMLYVASVVFALRGVPVSSWFVKWDGAFMVLGHRSVTLLQLHVP